MSAPKATSHHGKSHGHAGRRSSSGPVVPQPSHAERTRTLLAGQSTGYLSSQSKKLPGFPFGSVMPYALDPAGRPVFLISKMAMHTQNLDHRPEASLLVPDGSAAQDPLGAARVTLLGKAEPLPSADLEATRQLYLERHDKARFWVDYADFGFYRMDVAEIYFVGGFGVMGWVESGDYAAASPDPLMDAAAHIIEHMNQDHGDALVLLAAADADLVGKDAKMTAVDRLGFHLRLQVDGRYRGCRIGFPRQVEDARQAREVFVEMVQRARKAAES